MSLCKKIPKLVCVVVFMINSYSSAETFTVTSPDLPDQLISNQFVSNQFGCTGGNI